MAWIVALTDGSTTVDLNDGTSSFLNLNGFHAPPPNRNISDTGANLFRHGSDLIERTYSNRVVTISSELKGNDASTLGARVQDVWDILRKAEEFSKDGLGTRVQLKYQWESSTNAVFFNVIEGVVDLGSDLHSQYLSAGTRVRNAFVSLTCEPFAIGTTETLENWLADPSFEIAGTVFPDWTVHNGTGTTIRDTSKSKYGTASAKMVRTAGTAIQRIFQLFTTGFTNGDALSASVYFQAPSFAGSARAMLKLLAFNSAAAEVATGTAISTVTGTSWQRLTISNFVLNAASGTGTIQLDLRLDAGNGTGAGTGTIFWDGAYLTTGTAVPGAWSSGRHVYNHFDDKGQAHINYIDVYDSYGDVPAPTQIKVLENAARNQFWLGARHAGRQNDGGLIQEGEDFEIDIGSTWSVVAISGASGGSIGTGAGNMSTATSNPTARDIIISPAISNPPKGSYRVIASCAFHATGNSTIGLGLGYGYGGATRDPTVASQYISVDGSRDVGGFKNYDLGVIAIPPLPSPDDTTVGDYRVRLAYYLSSGSFASFQLDYVMLMPVDQGGAYVAKDTSAVDVIMVDSVSSIKGLSLLTTANTIKSFPPNQVGNAPSVHPKGSRFYTVHGTSSTTAKTTINTHGTFTITYTPQYLHIGT